MKYVINSEIEHNLLPQQDTFDHSRDGTAAREFKDAAVAGISFALAGLMAKEAIELVFPRGEFRETMSNGALTAGMTLGSVVFAAGSITAARWRRDEIHHRRKANELKND